MKILEKEIFDEEILHVSLGGSILTHTHFDAVTELVEEHFDKGIHKFSLDLGGVPFISSAGTGAILQLHKHLESKGGRLSLYGIIEDVQRLFSVTFIDKKLNIVANQDDSFDFLKE